MRRKKRVKSSRDKKMAFLGLFNDKREFLFFIFLLFYFFLIDGREMVI